MSSRETHPYPLIDLFAGPGGLGEGFASVQGGQDERRFRSAISIEKDEIAHQTLQLRHFFRAFPDGAAPEAYYDYLRGDITKKELFGKYEKQAKEAQKSARRIALGEHCHSAVRKLICNGLGGQKKWALVGGPPCQAYSLAGRSRMVHVPGFEKDERHRLYREYLRVLCDHRPPVFVMENVKGLLSAKVQGKSTLGRIIADLKNPGRAFGNGEDLEYRLYDLTSGANGAEGEDLRRYVVQAEEHGVPQARHRMFIVGIRDDLDESPRALYKEAAPTASEAIDDLPRLRSRISRGGDSLESWRDIVFAPLPGCGSWANRDAPLFFPKDHASRKYPGKPKTNHSALLDLFDRRLNSLSGHEARSHMESDLRRYRFAALFASRKGRSPKLADFPMELMPDHENAIEGRVSGNFADRFRVQVKDRPATTITSHISKDGHYYIHYDPDQCRSLTVREAARLQTFPDNYKFEGSRTAQYHQVGNAVPPYLAKQIGEIVAQLLDSMNGEA